MSALTNKCFTDTSILPSNILSLQGSDFFTVIENLTSDTIADLIRIQAIRNVRIFMLIPDILAVFKINSSELDYIKIKACFRLQNNTYLVKPGIETSLRYLRDLFATKIREHYYPDKKQQNDIENDTDTSTSSDDNVPSGQKRPASTSEQISNKRGRK
jgi:hypothetical protein